MKLYIENALKNAEYVSLDNTSFELLEKFDKLRKSNIVSKKELSGIWYFPKLTYDGAPQLLIRTNYGKNSIEYLMLCAQIHTYIEQDICYSVDVLKQDCFFIEGQQEELVEEILNNRVLTIYDREREDNA